MTRLLLLILLFAIASRAHAQDNPIPFLFTSEDDNRLIKENDSLKYYTASGDSANPVVINEEAAWYKLLNKEHRLIAEGAYIADGDKYLQEGRWVEKFDNGKVKLAGYYHKNIPIGTWEEYYSTGKIKTVSNYGAFINRKGIVSCRSGSYQEYYQSGKLKVNGFYAANFVTYSDTMTIEDPITGNSVIKVQQDNRLHAEKTGHWEYYDENGEPEKNEDY